MKRRDVLLALPAAAWIAQAQTSQKKPATSTTKKKSLANKTPSPTDMQKDRHVLAMMLLFMKRKDPVGGPATYPMIDLVKTMTQAQAALQFPVFGQIVPGVYTQVQTHLNLVAASPISAIQNHQQATKSIAFDAVGDYYPDNQCPFWTSIDKAVASLVP